MVTRQTVDILQITGIVLGVLGAVFAANKKGTSFLSILLFPLVWGLAGGFAPIDGWLFTGIPSYLGVPAHVLNGVTFAVYIMATPYLLGLINQGGGRAINFIFGPFVRPDEVTLASVISLLIYLIFISLFVVFVLLLGFVLAFVLPASVIGFAMVFALHLTGWLSLIIVLGATVVLSGILFGAAIGAATLHESSEATANVVAIIFTATGLLLTSIVPIFDIVGVRIV